MKKKNLSDYDAFIFADGAIFAAWRRGLINKVKIPVQELGGQKGEGAYFQENTVHTV